MSTLTKQERERSARALASLPDPDLTDPDNRELTAADIAKMRPARDALPAGVMEAFPRSKGGRPRLADAKRVVSLRLRPSLIAAYEAQGKDWRARMEAALIKAVTLPDKMA